MTKIIFIANKAPKYRLPFFNGLAKRLNIKFIFTHENDKIPELIADHICVKGIGYKKYKIHLKIIDILKKENPQKVILLPLDPLHLIDNLLIYRYLRKNKINYYIWSERWNFKNKSIKTRINGFLTDGILKFATKIFVSGIKAHNYMLKQVSKNKLIIIPDVSVVNYDHKLLSIEKKKLISKYHLKNKKCILFVGRLIKIKGLYYLIDALSKIDNKDVVLLIVGDKDFYNLGERDIINVLKKQIKKLSLEKRVLFLGELRDTNLAAAYSISNILVVPSITYKVADAWGLVVNEGMQFGLPIIATDAVGCVNDLIDNGQNGFVIKEKNSNELYFAIKKIIFNKQLANKMKYNSLNKIKGYNYKKMIQNFVRGLI